MNIRMIANLHYNKISEIIQDFKKYWKISELTFGTIQKEKEVEYVQNKQLI